MHAVFVLLRFFFLIFLGPLPDPVSRKSIKSAHSSRNRYSSQWTLSRPSQSQSTASARTLTSDWRTMGSHGITATESDSYSASLSQDTGESVPAYTDTPKVFVFVRHAFQNQKCNLVYFWRVTSFVHRVFYFPLSRQGPQQHGVNRERLLHL